MPEGTGTSVADKPEVLSVSGMADTIGDRISKELKEALAGFNPAKTDDDAPMAQDTPAAPELSDQLKSAMSELDKAGDQVVLMAKQDGKHVFEMLTSPQALARFEQTAVMQQGILAPIERAINPLVPNLPLGSLAVGAISGLFAGEFIDGFSPPTPGTLNVTNVVIKGVAAVGFVAGGQVLMSRQASMAAAAILTAQILADVLPLDAWIARIRGVFTGGQPTALEAQNWLKHGQPDPIGVTGHDIIADIF